MARVTVLAHLDRLSVFYALAPLVVHAPADVTFDVTTSLDHCLGSDPNRNLLIVRYFSTFDAGSDQDRRLDESIFVRLRDRYDRITFFDDAAGAGTTRFEVLPHVDWYLKKQLFRDRSLYTTALYGRQLYTDHYHRRAGVSDERPLTREPVPVEGDLAKVRLAYNSAVGSFPVVRLRQRAGVALARTVGLRAALRAAVEPRPVPARRRRPLGVHAHFRSAGPPTVRHQRALFGELAARDPLFSTGRISPRRYRRELSLSRATLSPFGWGEICLRDFEAMAAGSLLLKPDMSHLATWPDIFRPGQTYVPLAWNGSDLTEQAHRYANGAGDGRRRIAECAQQELMDARARLSGRVAELLDLIVA